MKTNFIIRLAFSFSCLVLLSCSGRNTKIGEQEWMNENLNATAFEDGTLIPEAKSDDEWKKAGLEKKPAWCYYNYKTEDPNIGKIYNWYAVSDKRGLAPKGWHVATNSEWNTLLSHVGNSNAAVKLKSKQGWKDDCNGTNEVGFNAQPCGGRGYAYALGNLSGWWWTASSSNTDRADYRHISCSEQKVQDGSYEKWAGMRVRCIRNN